MADKIPDKIPARSTDDISQLANLAKDGDAEALSELVLRFHTPARRVAHNILKNRESAEDAVQDAWLIALRKLNSLRLASSFGGWFYRIVANVALCRRQLESTRHIDVSDWEELLSINESGMSKDERIEYLRMALPALSQRDHIVTSLHYFSRVPLATIARLLDIPQGTVKSRLYHARQVLRKEILAMQNKPNKRAEHIPADFRETIAGMQGKIQWQKIFTGNFSGWSANGKPIQASTTPANWEVVGEDGLLGDEYTSGTLLTYGDPTWTDIELSLLITPLGGGNAQIFFRDNREMQNTYVFDMYIGWQAIGIRRLMSDGQGKTQNIKLSVVNYPLEHGREYAVDIAARGESITTYIDGALVNQVRDSTISQGQITLNVWEARTLYRDIRLRTLG
ncbi:MAG: sigma-70 family RNA polymerase sigma factor [Chloroflexota bacterium]